MRWTEEEYMEWLEERGKTTARKKPKRSKYNNKKTWIDGICFDSKKEADYYSVLKTFLAAGEIKGFCRQPEFILVEGNAENRAITYKADFICVYKNGDEKTFPYDIFGKHIENIIKSVKEKRGIMYYKVLESPLTTIYIWWAGVR